MKLSKKQKEVIKFMMKKDAMLCLCGGAVRSGKTTAANIAFSIFVLDRCMDHDSAIISNSIGSAMRNCGNDILTYLNELGAEAILSNALGSRIIVRYGGRESSIWIIGSSDAKGRKRIQGSTLGALKVDEIVNVDEEMWDFAFSRLSVDGAKCWATFNPAHPGHWVKKRLVDAPENFAADVFHFTFDDNPGLSDFYKSKMESGFTGHQHQRMILGMWSAASGLIFPTWSKMQKPHAHAPGRWHIALDWASAGTFHALMIKEFGKPHSYSACVDELVYDAREAGVVRTEDEHRDALIAFAKQYKAERCTVWVDPATPNTFKSKLRRSHFVVRNADNDVLPGLTTTASMLKRQNMVVSDNCPVLQEEMMNYLWDDRSDIDKPIKENDHGCDALRYYCHSTGKFSKSLLNRPLKVRELFHGNKNT